MLGLAADPKDHSLIFEDQMRPLRWSGSFWQAPSAVSYGLMLATETRQYDPARIFVLRETYRIILPAVTSGGGPVHVLRADPNSGQIQQFGRAGRPRFLETGPDPSQRHGSDSGEQLAHLADVAAPASVHWSEMSMRADQWKPLQFEGKHLMAGNSSFFAAKLQ
jgi:hypothetical protein